MSISSAEALKSQRASITSRPLFIIVAESIVIFAPIRQVGWFSAWAVVAFSISSFDELRNGPPDAVRINRFTSRRFSPRKHWCNALCSLSTGNNSAPDFSAARVISSPAMTSVSLFANATRLPSSSARCVGSNPSAPTTAPITISTRSQVATSQSPSTPRPIFGAATFRRFNSKRSFAALSSSLTETTCGRYSSTCSASNSTFDPAPKAATPNSPLKASTTRRVLRPIEPVEPRIEICFINSSLLQGGGVLPVAPLSFERFYFSFQLLHQPLFHQGVLRHLQLTRNQFEVDVSPGRARHQR